MNKDKYYIGEAIASVRRLHSNVLSRLHGELTIHQLLSAQAENIVEGHRQGNEAVVFHLSCWCPDLIGQSAERIMNGVVSLPQVQSALAREYGFDNWSVVPDDGTVDTEFEEAVDLMLHGDYEEFGDRLNDKPALVSQTSRFGHRATLLHYLGANGVETQRQVSPCNAAEMARLLLQHGADVNARANIYGGSTARQLIETSIHPAEARVTGALLQVVEKYEVS